jgi:uncharacterized protein (TIGR02217 family)
VAFHNVVFPLDYSRGAVGGPEFRTTVVSTAAGYEQRNAEWATARLKWDVSRLLYDESTREQTIAFFRARRGRAHGFLFYDWTDHSVGMAWNPAARQLEHVGAHNFAVGDGATVAFQLVKIYDSGGYQERRRITRPKSPVRVYVNGTVQAQPAQCSVNYQTGVVTFAAAPPNGAQIGWSGEFYVPVRFDTDALAIECLSPTSADASLTIVEIRE